MPWVSSPKSAFSKIGLVCLSKQAALDVSSGRFSENWAILIPPILSNPYNPYSPKESFLLQNHRFCLAEGLLHVLMMTFDYSVVRAELGDGGGSDAPGPWRRRDCDPFCWFPFCKLCPRRLVCMLNLLVLKPEWLAAFSVFSGWTIALCVIYTC